MSEQDKLQAAVLARLGLAHQVNAQTPDWQKRVLRVQRLAERWNRENGEAIAQKIDAFLRADVHEAVRMAAVRALGRIFIEAPEVVAWEPFLRALGDKHPAVQVTMVQVLMSFVEARGQHVLSPFLIEMLWQKRLPATTGTEKLLRLSILQLLGLLGTQLPALALVELVKATHDADWQIREAAVLALGKVLPAEKQVQFSHALFDEDQFVRQAARLVIDQRASWPIAKMLAALRAEESTVQERAACALGEWGQGTPEILDALRQLAVNPQATEQARVAALLAVAQLVAERKTLSGAQQKQQETLRIAAEILNDVLDMPAE